MTEIQTQETEMLKEIDEICSRHNITYYLNCGSVLGAIRHGGPIPWDTDVDIGVPFNQIDEFNTVMKAELSDKFYIDYYDNNKSFFALFPRIGLKGFSTNKLHIDVFKLVGLPSNPNQQRKFSKKSNFLKTMFFYKTKRHSGSIKSILFNTIIKILLLPFSRNWIIHCFDKHCSQYPYEEAEFIMNPCGHYGLKNVLKKTVFGKGTRVKYADIEVIIPEHYDYYLKHYYGDYMKLPPEGKRQVKDIYNIE